jgi:hypothetical protein
VNLEAAQLNQLGLNAFALQLLQNPAQQDGCVTSLARAAVECNYLDAAHLFHSPDVQNTHPSIVHLRAGEFSSGWEQEAGCPILSQFYREGWESTNPNSHIQEEQ